MGKMKTNKTLLKRVKVSKKGKLSVRKAGKCHFNAKMSRSKQLNAKRMITLNIKKSDVARYLPNH